MKGQKRNLMKNRSSQKGNVILLCVVAIAILLTLTNVITSQVIGRSYFTKRIADYNDYVLLLEDANIQYRKECAILEAETLELVEYYFQNQFYSRNQVNAFSGPNSHHNKYLKNCITNPFQKMIKAYYDQTYEDAKNEVTGIVNGEDLNDTIIELANFLYIYMMSYRMSTSSPEVPAAYGLEKNMTDLTNALKTKLNAKGTFVMNSAITIKEGLITYSGSSDAIDGETLLTYLGYDQTGVFAVVRLNSVLTVDATFGFELSKVKQEVVFELHPETFDVEFNGATYNVSRDSNEDKLVVTTWVKEGEK